MKAMKQFLLFLSCSAVLAWSADLPGVHTVYILSMSHGMDQYLANRLTNDHVLQVVTDPKLADAILTDHIGKGLDADLEDLMPAPPPAKPEAAKTQKADQPASPGMFTDTVNKLDNPASRSTFGRAKGTIFLVDLKSHQVLWSVYQPAKDTTSKEMDRTASDIVSRLKKDLNPGQK